MKEVRDVSSQHRYTLSKTNECDKFCTFKPINLFLNILGKKLLVYDVFQNTAKRPLCLPSVGEVLGVAGVKQAMVLLSVNWSSSLALN